MKLPLSGKNRIIQKITLIEKENILFISVVQVEVLINIFCTYYLLHILPFLQITTNEYMNHNKCGVPNIDRTEEPVQKSMRKFKNHSRIQTKNKTSHKLLNFVFL